MIAYPLALDKVYADCVSCDAVHIVDKYVTYHFCNHCRSSLRKRGA